MWETKSWFQYWFSIMGVTSSSWNLSLTLCWVFSVILKTSSHLDTSHMGPANGGPFPPVPLTLHPFWPLLWMVFMCAEIIYLLWLGSIWIYFPMNLLALGGRSGSPHHTVCRCEQRKEPRILEVIFLRGNSTSEKILTLLYKWCNGVSRFGESGCHSRITLPFFSYFYPWAKGAMIWRNQISSFQKPLHSPEIRAEAIPLICLFLPSHIC